MPAPYVPFLDGDLLADVFPDSIGISVIAFVISLSISRIIANKHKYQVLGSGLGAENTYFSTNTS